MHFVKYESSSAQVNEPMTQHEANVEFIQSLYHTTSNRTKHVKPYMYAMILNNVSTTMGIDTYSDVTVISSMQFEQMFDERWSNITVDNGQVAHITNLFF